jgi:hypothetical protein
MDWGWGWGGGGGGIGTGLAIRSTMDGKLWQIRFLGGKILPFSLADRIFLAPRHSSGVRTTSRVLNTMDSGHCEHCSMNTTVCAERDGQCRTPSPNHGRREEGVWTLVTDYRLHCVRQLTMESLKM